MSKKSGWAAIDRSLHGDADRVAEAEERAEALERLATEMAIVLSWDYNLRLMPLPDWCGESADDISDDADVKAHVRCLVTETRALLGRTR